MPKKKPEPPEQAELARLKRENYMLTLENAYLKNLRALAEPEERSQGKSTKRSSGPKGNSRKRG